jgi:hypothetical protein
MNTIAKTCEVCWKEMILKPIQNNRKMCLKCSTSKNKERSLLHSKQTSDARTNRWGFTARQRNQREGTDA